MSCAIREPRQACVEKLLIGAANIGNDLTEEELDRAKHHLRMSLFGALDGTTAIAEDVGRQLLVYGRRMTAPEFCLRVAAVTVDDVRRCARQRFCDANIALTGLGRVEGVALRPDAHATRILRSLYVLDFKSGLIATVLLPTNLNSGEISFCHILSNVCEMLPGSTT